MHYGGVNFIDTYFRSVPNLPASHSMACLGSPYMTLISTSIE